MFFKLTFTPQSSLSVPSPSTTLILLINAKLISVTLFIVFFFFFSFSLILYTILSHLPPLVTVALSRSVDMRLHSTDAISLSPLAAPGRYFNLQFACDDTETRK